MHLGSQRKALFLQQLKLDVQLLERLNIMDYSLLVGIHIPERDAELKVDSHVPHESAAPAPARRVSDDSYGDEYVQGSARVLENEHLFKFAETIFKRASTRAFPQHPATSLLNEVESKEEKLKYLGKGAMLGLDDGGIVSERGPEVCVYYLGVIDILQVWVGSALWLIFICISSCILLLQNMKKRAEHFLKALREDGTQISAVNPSLYADRFFRFIAAHVQ